jgi:aromatic ring hydroxylase
MILGAEAVAEPDQFGVMRPKDSLLYASQVFQQAMYPVLLNQIRGLMGGSLIQLPATVDDLRAPGSAADIARYVRWPKAGGHERVKLLKLMRRRRGTTGGCEAQRIELLNAAQLCRERTANRQPVSFPGESRDQSQARGVLWRSRQSRRPRRC